MVDNIDPVAGLYTLSPLKWMAPPSVLIIYFAQDELWYIVSEFE